MNDHEALKLMAEVMKDTQMLTFRVPTNVQWVIAMVLRKITDADIKDSQKTIFKTIATIFEDAISERHPQAVKRHPTLQDDFTIGMDHTPVVVDLTPGNVWFLVVGIQLGLRMPILLPIVWPLVEPVRQFEAALAHHHPEAVTQVLALGWDSRYDR